MTVTAIPINCTLKRSGGEDSSTDAMIAVLKQEFEKAGVKVSDTIRMADHNILPGVTSDEGDDDAWPDLRETILAHDILIFGGPIWLGQIGSIAKRVLERMDAFLSETDDKGHMPSSAKSRLRRSSATRMALTPAPRSFSRRSTTWAGPYRRGRPAIGWARRCMAPTSSTLNRRLIKSAKPPRCSPSMPRTSLVCSRSSPTPDPKPAARLRQRPGCGPSRV